MNEGKGILPFFTQFITYRGFTNFKKNFIPPEHDIERDAHTSYDPSAEVKQYGTVDDEGKYFIKSESFREHLYLKLSDEGKKAIATFESEVKQRDTKAAQSLFNHYLVKAEKLKEDLAAYPEAKKYDEIERCLNKVIDEIGRVTGLNKVKSKRGRKSEFTEEQKAWVNRTYWELKRQNPDGDDTPIYDKIEKTYSSKFSGKVPSRSSMRSYVGKKPDYRGKK